MGTISPKVWSALRVVTRLTTVHVVVGAVGAGGLATMLAARPDLMRADKVEVVGPLYDPERLGVWMQEQSPGRSTVRFMLGRSRIFESVDGQPVPIIPRPERVGPEWMEDWSQRIPRMHAQGIMVSTDEVREYAFGWPRLCLKTTELSEIKAMGGWREYTEGLATFGDFILPVLPLASGLAYNTALLGIPGSATLIVVGLVRTLARKRAGVCIGCAYELDGELLICPECGRSTGTGGDASDSEPLRRAA